MQQSPIDSKMPECNYLVMVDVKQLLVVTKGNHNTTNYIEPNPEPPHRTPQLSMLSLSQQTAGKPHFDS